MSMEIKSTVFNDGERIPDFNVMKAIGGDNTSLPFQWTNVPAGTKSFAFSIIDTHPVANNWIHWLVINIPVSSINIAEGVSLRNMTVGCLELRNSFGKAGYGGPQPPEGSGDHTYVCTVYALSIGKLYFRINPSFSDFKEALEGSILAQASITGKYGR